MIRHFAKTSLKSVRCATAAQTAERFRPSFGNVDQILPKVVSISLPVNTEVETAQLPVLWMRWNCECPKCKQAGSGQKILSPADWPANPEFDHVWLENTFIKFELKGEDHVGKISMNTLRRYLQNENQRKKGATKMTYHNYPNEWIPTLDFSEIQRNSGQYKLTTQIAVNGYCLIKGCPTNKDTVLNVARTISMPIPSVYGLTFDVVSEDPNNISNIAYSNVGLLPHVDLTYFEAPPGVQYFLCRRNDECVVGGESTLVDAFAAALDLKRRNPKHFEVLSTTPVRFQKIHYDRDQPVHIEWESPHFVLGTDGDVTRVNWAPAFEGSASLECYSHDYFEAYKAYQSALAVSKTNFVRKLTPGECLVFNNRRMLHGRNGFELNGGVRHLEGCYTNLCEFRSRAQVLENTFGHGNLIQKVGNGNNI